MLTNGLTRLSYAGKCNRQKMFEQEFDERDRSYIKDSQKEIEHDKAKHGVRIGRCISAKEALRRNELLARCRQNFLASGEV